MGRGRAKAKQTKVARDLKYRTWEPDLGQLERELKGSGKDGDAEPDEQDPYAEYQDGYEPDDDSRRTG